MVKPRRQSRAAAMSLGAVLLLAAALAAPSVSAQPVTERSRQKQAAEKERADLQQRLAVLKRDINQTETAKGNAADSLAESEAGDIARQSLVA